MARLEELMGLFGGVDARGAQGLGGGVDDRDPRRRRAGLDSGFGGIAGGNVSLMDILPHLQGLRSYDYSGPNIRGLADLLPAMGNFQDLMGPSRRHLERQGADFSVPPGLADMPDLPPGVDVRNAIAGPNPAPGNVDTGFALGQAPGLPPQARGVAEGQQPHTQAWRNVAPGFSAAAQFGYGTPEFEQRMHGLGYGGRPSAIAGGPEAAQVAPGAGGGVAGLGGGTSRGAGPTPVKAGGPAEPVRAAGGGAGVGKPGAPGAAQDFKGGASSPGGGGQKTIAAKGPTGAPAKPRTTKVATSPKTGITKTVSTGGGTGKYVNVTVGKNTTQKEAKAAIANVQHPATNKPQGTSTTKAGPHTPAAPAKPAPKPAPSPGSPSAAKTEKGNVSAPTTTAKKGSTKPAKQVGGRLVT